MSQSPPAEPVAEAPTRSIWESPWVNMLGRLMALGLVFGVFVMLVGPRFTNRSNIEDILVNSAVYATAALGVTMIIISAGIDLSVGSQIGLAVVVVAFVLNLGYEVPEAPAPPAAPATRAATRAGGPTSAPTTQSARAGATTRGSAPVQPKTRTVYYAEDYPTIWPVLAIVTGVVVATLIGLVNGLAITGLRVVPFIITLGTLSVFRGLAKGVAAEQNIYPPETWLNKLMDPVAGNVDSVSFFLPLGIWLMLVASIVAAFVLRYTRFGRHVFAVGSNEQTARLCGVPIARTKILVYTLSGLFAGLGGLMLYSRSGIGNPMAGWGFELFVIAAVVIGGGSLMGGEGSILGTLVGAIIIATLAAGGVQAGWPKWVQEIVTGGIIITAVALDRLRRRKMT